MKCLEILPNSILEDMNCIGTVDDVIANVEKFKNAGTTHLAFMNRGPDVNYVYEIIHCKIIPYSEELKS